MKVALVLSFLSFTSCVRFIIGVKKPSQPTIEEINSFYTRFGQNENFFIADTSFFRCYKMGDTIWDLYHLRYSVCENKYSIKTPFDPGNILIYDKQGFLIRTYDSTFCSPAQKLWIRNYDNSLEYPVDTSDIVAGTLDKQSQCFKDPANNLPAALTSHGADLFVCIYSACYIPGPYKRTLKKILESVEANKETRIVIINLNIDLRPGMLQDLESKIKRVQ